MITPRFAWRAALTLAVAAGSGCAYFATYDDADLDSGLHPIPSVLLSRTHPTPTDADRDRPVVIAAHGFSSTSWEAGPLTESLAKRGIRVSAVTLGGHGTSLEDFRRSDWRAWGAPMLAEYKALRAQGYRKIAIAGHSTGATLWLRALADGTLGTVPERMIFVAPLIEFAPKTRGIYFAGLFPWVGIRGITRPVNGESKGRLYHVRPVEALQNLAELTTGVRRELTTGLPLPARTRVLVIQGDGDDVVDASGTRLLTTGLIGAQTRLVTVGSWMHNPIGPDGIQGHRFTPAEAALRERLLQAIGDHVAQP